MGLLIVLLIVTTATAAFHPHKMTPSKYHHMPALIMNQSRRPIAIMSTSKKVETHPYVAVMKRPQTRMSLRGVSSFVPNKYNKVEDVVTILKKYLRHKNAIKC
jgi:hypothetical protein